MPTPQVENEITQPVPGPGRSVILEMDFGNLPQIIAGDTVASCSVLVTPVTAPSSPTLTASATTINAAGYRARAAFSGGAAGKYTVKWSPTLTSAGAIPPRTGVLYLV